MITTDQIAVYIGLDVGKQEHHACALNPSGDRLHDKPLPQDETRLRELFTQLATHGPVLVVVDQPASIGALPIAVARETGAHVAYLPGLAMRRIADLHLGNAKTDARDAYVIAEAARTMPHALRRVDTGDEALADLQVIIGFDDDLAGEVTRVSNRIRGLLTQIHPALERAIGPRITHPAALALLTRYGGPTGLAKAGRRGITTTTKKHAPRSWQRITQNVLDALGQQTVTVPGTTAAELVLPQLATQLGSLLEQRKAVAAQVEEMLDAHPLSPVLMSMPGGASGPQHASCSRSATAARSPHRGIWPPTPDWPPSPADPARQSAGNTPPGPATNTSNERSSSRPSQPCQTPPAAPTTTANAPKARSTTPP